MASFDLKDNDLVIKLSPLEKLGALRGDVRIPLAAIREVRVSDDAWSELRGFEHQGPASRGIISLGRRRGPGVVDFAAVYGKQPAVVAEADGAPFDRLVVSCSDAANQAARITEALPSWADQ